MQVKYVLFVTYCAVSLFLHITNASDICIFRWLSREKAYCSPSDSNRTFHYVPRISHRITYLDLNDQPLKQLPRFALRNITTHNELDTVLFSNCQIEHIHVDAFVHLDSLKYLFVTGNRLTRFETGTFQHTKRLEIFFAIENKIDTLQSGLFHDLVHLKEVSFKNNSLTGIEQDTFRNTPSLFYIDVEYNKLEYLSSDFTSNFATVSRLYIEHNPWKCDCNLREFFATNQAKTPLYVYTRPECYNPLVLRGKKWYDLTSDEFKCDAQIILPKNDTRMVTLGTNVTLSCAVYGDPMPKIKWHKGTSVITSGNWFINSYMNTYYLNHTFTVQEEDLGVYYCSAYNTDEIKVSSTTLTVDIPPK